jgi:hypothetical protein
MPSHSRQPNTKVFTIVTGKRCDFQTAKLHALLCPRLATVKFPNAADENQRHKESFTARPSPGSDRRRAL